MQSIATVVVLFVSLLFVSGHEKCPNTLMVRLLWCQRETVCNCSNPSPTPKPFPQRWPSCGVRNSGVLGSRLSRRFFTKAEFGELPWAALIIVERFLYNGKQIRAYACGGSLIHPNVVLTAASCVHKVKTPIIVRIGEWDTSTYNEPLPHQDRRVEKVITHENYNASLIYDIALLIVKRPFYFADNVGLICLPKQSNVILSKKCIASRWSPLTVGNVGHYRVMQNKIELPMVDRETCQNKLRKNKFLGPNFKLHKSIVCAGGISGKDTCRGDSGSALVCPIPGKESHYLQVGIVSWGLSCGKALPAAYVNVAMFRNWIDCHLRRFNFII